MGFDDVVLPLVLPIGVKEHDERIRLVDPVAIDLPEVALLRVRNRAFEIVAIGKRRLPSRGSEKAVLFDRLVD